MNLRHGVWASPSRLEEQMGFNGTHGLAVEISAKVRKVILQHVSFLNTPLCQIVDIVAVDVSARLEK